MKKALGMFLSLALLAGGCINSGVMQSLAAETEMETEGTMAGYPVTIENNGNTITYEKAPERMVVLSYDAAEIVAALGLEDQVIALAPCMNQIEEVMEEYREAVAGMPLFDESSMTNGVPNLETVLAAQPDFVYGSYYSFFPANCGAAEDYLANDIGIYASEVTYVESASLTELYNDILNIGKIFGVETRAEELVNSLKEREQAVTDRVSGLDKVSVFVFDMDNGDGTYSSTGGANFVDSLIEAAGGRDIFEELGSAYSTVSPEEIIARDPEYVLAVSYYTEDDGENKMEGMKTSADFSGIRAVQNDNLISLGGLAVGASSGLQSLEALETLAEFFHPEAFENQAEN